MSEGTTPTEKGDKLAFVSAGNPTEEPTQTLTLPGPPPLESKPFVALPTFSAGLRHATIMLASEFKDHLSVIRNRRSP
jgi:hypothetical protein